MKTGSDIKNRVKYRLTGTLDGNLLVSFYHLDVFNQQAVNWPIAEQLVDNTMGLEVLDKGNSIISQRFISCFNALIPTSIASASNAPATVVHG